MAERLSVYLDNNTMYKLGDIKHVLERDLLSPLSMSKVVSYAIVRAWQAEFVEALDPANWSDEVRAAVAKYAPASGGNGRDEQ